MHKSIYILLLSTFIACEVPAQSSQTTPYQLHWEFPLPRTHTGVLMGNGLQGLMVWGKDTQLNITIARAGFWDHRGGFAFKPSSNFEKIKTLLYANDKKGIDEAFRVKGRPESYPKRPYQLGGGRLELHLPEGHMLSHATLDVKAGTLAVQVKSSTGSTLTIRLEQSRDQEFAWVELPPGLSSKVELKLVASYDHAAVRKHLEKIAVSPPNRWKDERAQIEGFTQSLPKDIPLSIAYQKEKDRLKIGTHLGENPEKLLKNGLKNFDIAKSHSENSIWWKDYWQDVPVVTLPDRRLQELYTYGLYKQACATPPQGLPCSLQGVFMEEYQVPPWSNDYHFNINIQMIYWPALASNRTAHLKPLWNMIKAWIPLMLENGKLFYGAENALLMPHAVDDQCRVVGDFWTGSIDQACAAWMAQLAWLHYRYTMDESILKEIAMPLLEGAFNGYYAMTERKETAAGNYQLSLPISVSPEWKGRRMDAWGENASFQLAAFRMTAANLQKAAQVLSLKKDPRWQEVLEHLPNYTLIDGPARLEYPEGKRKRIALWKGMDLVESHRHHSHLAGIYPFRTLDTKAPEHREIVHNSIANWTLKGRGMWSGWCVPWASILQSRVGNVDAAVEMLHYWEETYTNLGRGTLHNTDYRGTSGISSDWNGVPFMGEHREIMQLDAGFGALDAIHNLLVQEAQGEIHIVPNIPRDWKEFSFERIGTEGNFSVSAVVKNKQVVEVTVISRADAALALNPGMGDRFTVNGEKYTNAVFQKKCKKGEKLVFTQNQ